MNLHTSIPPTLKKETRETLINSFRKKWCNTQQPQLQTPVEKHLEMEKGERWDLETEEECLRAFAVEEAHILSAIFALSSFLFCVLSSPNKEEISKIFSLLALFVCVCSIFWYVRQKLKASSYAYGVYEKCNPNLLFDTEALAITFCVFLLLLFQGTKTQSNEWLLVTYIWLISISLFMYWRWTLKCDLGCWMWFVVRTLIWTILKGFVFVKLW